MSLLTERLPDSIEVCGVRWPIDPDFRLMVELECAVTSREGLDGKALGALLERFYPRGVPPVPEEAVDALLWFYRCGTGEPGEGGPGGEARSYGFDQDGEALYASFLQAYRIDLTVDPVHWWQFRRLMFGLPAETPFAQRLHYRTADTSSMGREQKKHYARMKKLFAVRENARAGETLAQRDQRMLAYIDRRFAEVDGGKDREQGK